MATLMAQRSHQLFLEFWLVLSLPAFLDILGGRGILSTLFGAVLWGMALVIAAVRPQTQDEAFRTRLGRILLFIVGTWLSYWALAFVEIPRRIEVQPNVTQWLTWAHAGLLTAGLGMVLVLGLASVAWIFQYQRLQQSSWQRRRFQKWKLPSLEALGGICQKSSRLAFLCWGLGLFLAILTAILRWDPNGAPVSDPNIMAWWLDSKVMTTALLWLLLAIAFQLGLIGSKGRLWLYRVYAALALLFIVLFASFTNNSSSHLHESLTWFVR